MAVCLISMNGNDGWFSKHTTKNQLRDVSPIDLISSSDREDYKEHDHIIDSDNSSEGRSSLVIPSFASYLI
jgi:hypothetical protein